jgi:hypothetical protein
MPGRQGLRPLKAWRYVAAFNRELMLCAASVRVGRARQAFWAIWDRAGERLNERTVLGRGPVRLSTGRLLVTIETVCPSGSSYAWTRKQGGIAVAGTVALSAGGNAPVRFHGRAIVDDTAGYYERHTRWRWSAGVGTADDGRALAWNLVEGVNDPAERSERTLWIDGAAQELPPSPFAPDLSSVGELVFAAEAVRAHDENRLLIRSSYRQPFGTFAGRIGPLVVREGFGVMEDHDVWW